MITERKDDFSLSIQEFIDKYKVPDFIKKNKSDKNVMLFFPDFDKIQPLWKRVVYDYCIKCKESMPGQLFIYLDDDENTDRYIEELSDYIADNYDGSGDIYVQVGQIKSKRELFESADYLITSRNDNTVGYTCLADLYNVKILSGADSHDLFRV